MKKLYFFLFLMISSTLLYAQKRMIEGTVKDDLGETLPGVNIIVQGTNTGTVTDVEGKFTLEIEGDDVVLVFSSVGYTREEVSVGNQSVIDMVLIPDITSLEEIVVVGYGTEQKKDLTGSLSAIKSEEIANRQSIQVSDALQGAVAGVTVTRTGSAPGATSTIRVRGITTFNNNDPLVIVDGVRSSLGINDINPADIESISVLKDAATAAIYGSEAAAGVILITTKRAKEGKTKIEYSYDYGVNSMTKIPEYVGTKRYMQLWEQEYNPGSNIYPQDVIDNYDNLHANDPDRYPDTNWWNLMMGENSTRQRHNLAISKGTDKMKTRASFSYMKENAFYVNKEYERLTARINNQFNVSQILTGVFDVSFKRTNSTDPNSGNPVGEARRWPGIYDAIREDGKFAYGKDGTNPYAALNGGGINNKHYNLLNAKIGFILEPTKGLKVTGNFTPSFDFNKEKNFQTKYDTYDYGAETGKTQGVDKLSEVRNEEILLSKQLLVNYDKTIGQHSFGGMIGYEDYDQSTEKLSASRQGFTFNDIEYLDQGNQDLRDNGGSASNVVLKSYFGRLKYDYAHKYMLQANVRSDQSSRFSKQKRVGYFPSLSAGWAISEESFMKGLPVLSNLKFRGSYGALGNDRTNSFFAYLAEIKFSNALFYQGKDLVSQISGSQQVLDDATIQWETTKTYDAGIDLGLFDDKFSFTYDYYVKNTEDILMELVIPGYMGFGNPTTNVGSIQVKGWDLEMGYKNKIGDLGYSISANLSDSKSKVTKINNKDGIISGNTINKQGYEFKEWFGYQTAGLYQTDDELKDPANVNLNGKQAPGDVHYIDQLTVDTDGDGVPDAGDGLINEKDRVPLGGSLPRYIFGGNLGANYKGFDFSLTFQGVGKRKDMLNGLEVQPFDSKFGNVPKIIDGKFWSPNNTPEQNLAAKYPRINQSASGNYSGSDFWLISGAYMRVKVINLGYTIPTALTDRAKLQRLRFYVSLRDFFAINKYPKGWDPEVDAGSYPITKTTMVGLDLTF